MNDDITCRKRSGAGTESGCANRIRFSVDGMAKDRFRDQPKRNGEGYNDEHATRGLLLASRGRVVVNERREQ